MSDQDIRWKQRFSNFQRAFVLLREAIDTEPAQLNQLEKEGIIQRFEYKFELAWKVLKDKVESDGIILDYISPKAVVREAFAAKYINDADGWLKMIGDRNLMSRTYDFAKFEQVIAEIRACYLGLLDELYFQLLQEMIQ